MEQALVSRMARWAERFTNLFIPALTAEPRPDPQLAAAITELQQINDTLRTIARRLDRR